MKTLVVVALIAAGLLGCNGSSDDSNDSNDSMTPTPDTPQNLQTTKVKLQFNLPSTSELLDTQEFNQDDLLSYNAATSFHVCEPSGDTQTLSLHFVHVSAQKWDVYLSFESELLNVEEGELGGTGQYKASLLFDANGQFVKQLPYIIKTTDLSYSGIDYQMELDFYNSPTTNLDQPFNAKMLDVNGC